MRILGIGALVALFWSAGVAIQGSPAHVRETDYLPHNWRLAALAAAGRGDCVSALNIFERAEMAYGSVTSDVRAEFHESGTCLPRDPAAAADLGRVRMVHYHGMFR